MSRARKSRMFSGTFTFNIRSIAGLECSFLYAILHFSVQLMTSLEDIQDLNTTKV